MFFFNAEGRQRVALVPKVVATAVAQSQRGGTQSFCEFNNLRRKMEESVKETQQCQQHQA